MPTQIVKINIKRLISIALDLMAIPTAWFLAFMFYYDTILLHRDIFTRALLLFPIIFLAQILSYRYFNVHRGMWRYASLPDVIKILKAVAFAVALAAITLFFLNTSYYFPRSILPMYALLMVALLSCTRLSVRLLRQFQSSQSSSQRILIVGAGYAGEGLVRELLRDTNKRFIPVAFVDDRQSKFQQEIQGIRVLGKCKDIPKIVQDHRIDLIFIAVP